MNKLFNYVIKKMAFIITCICLLECASIKAMEQERPLGQRLFSYFLGGSGYENIPLTPLKYDIEKRIVNGNRFNYSLLIKVLDDIVRIMEVHVGEIGSFSVWVKDKQFYKLKIGAYTDVLKELQRLWIELKNHVISPPALARAFYEITLNLYQRVHYLQVCFIKELFTAYPELRGEIVPYMFVDLHSQKCIQGYVDEAGLKIDVTLWFESMREFEKNYLEYKS